MQTLTRQNKALVTKITEVTEHVILSVYGTVAGEQNCLVGVIYV